MWAERARRRLRNTWRFTILLTVLNVAAALSEFYEANSAGVILMTITLPMIFVLLFWTIPKDRRELRLAQQYEGE